MSYARIQASLVLLAVLATSCRSLECKSAQEPELEIVHISGGDGPLVTRLRIYPDAQVEIHHLGGGARCARATSFRNSQVSGMLQSERFGADFAALSRAAGQAKNADVEEAIVRFRGMEVAVRRYDIPPELKPLLQALDGFFLKTLGRQYDIRLTP